MAGRKKTIMLIDDDARIIETVGDRLRFEGFHVVPVYTAEEGLRLLKKRRLDLIILDIGMPGMNGMTFLNQIVAIGGVRPLILVFTARSNVEEFRAHPAVDMAMNKTSDPGDLIRELHRLLAARASAAGAEPER